jgi:hypothetical protein
MRGERCFPLFFVLTGPETGIVNIRVPVPALLLLFAGEQRRLEIFIRLILQGYGLHRPPLQAIYQRC